MYPHFDIDNMIYYQHGRGNNWALGYNDIISYNNKKAERKKFNKKEIKIGKEMDFTKFKSIKN